MSDMFPHTVTVYNVTAENPDTLMPDVQITILRGVFLEISQGANIVKTGLENADAATLHIPMRIKAVNAVTGQEQKYVPPKEYDRLTDKSGFWTVGRRDNQTCFFVKGEVVEQMADYAAINDRYDFCYAVTTVDIPDYGNPELRDFVVGGK